MTQELEIEVQEYLDEYEELYPTIQKSKDEMYPEWLFKPVFNDFDDNYYQQSFVDSSLKASIMKLKRRYNDVFQYLDAMEIYNEYMDKMVEKYGSMRVIHNAMTVGLLEDPIPSKPKLKQNKKNMAMLRSGNIPTRKIPEFHVESDDIIAIARQLYPIDKAAEEEIEENLRRNPTKEEKKQFQKIREKVESKSRRRNMYRSNASNAGTDFIVEYLNQVKKGSYGTSGEDVFHQKRRSILDIEEEIIHEKTTRPELLELEGLNRYEEVIRGSRLVNGAAQLKTDVYKILYQEGYDIFGKFNKGGMKKESVKMVRSELGISAPLTKKQMKKMKKMAKREKAKIQKKADASSALENVLLNNKIDVTRDGNGNLSMRLRDLFRDD